MNYLIFYDIKQLNYVFKNKTDTNEVSIAILSINELNLTRHKPLAILYKE